MEGQQMQQMPLTGQVPMVQPAMMQMPMPQQQMQYQTPMPGQHTMPMAGGAINPQNYQNATPLQALGRFPLVVDCPSCHHRGPTRVDYITSGFTHGCALLLGSGSLCLAVWVPYAFNGFKDAQHSCGNCGTPLALAARTGGTRVLVHT